MEKKQITTQNQSLMQQSQHYSIQKAKETLNDSVIISSARISGLTLETAKDSAQLSLMKKEFGEAETARALVKVINEISLLTNTNMDAPVKALCAKMLLNNFWYLKLDELLMILRDGIMGKYGKIYGNFCFTTLTEWIEKFQQEKTGYIEDKNLSYTSHEKVIREKEFGIGPQEHEAVSLSEHLKKINEFWREEK